MYRIIGADGRPYGPVSADQVRQWIRERRANAQTLAKAEDATEWRPLIAFAEFADAQAAQTGLTPPPPVPPTASVDPDALAEEVLRRDYRLIIGDCFSRAWRTLTENFWPIVGVSALVGLILFFTNMVYVGIILTGPLVGGLYMYYLKSIRGERATMEDAFSGFTLAFVQLMLASIVSGLLTCLGVLACVLPGIYLAVAWSRAISSGMGVLRSGAGGVRNDWTPAAPHATPGLCACRLSAANRPCYKE